MMNNILELVPASLPPITADKTVVITASAITFQNVGDATVTLNNHYTIQPNQSFQIAVSNDAQSVITGRFSFRFGAGASPKLEVFYLIPNHEEFGNYAQQ